MSRPNFTAPVGATVHFNVPPDWFISISAISRKNYNRLITIETNVLGARFGHFYNKFGTVPGSMRLNPGTSKTFPIAPRPDPVTLDVSCTFADTNAVVTPKKLTDKAYLSSKLDVQESAKAENASDEIPDYVTFFVFVEDTPDSQQVAGSGQFDDAVITIHLVKTNPNKIPPPPPKDTLPGYNPVLDLPRPSKLENYMKAYDVSFLLDDSGSMAQENRWVEAGNALNGLANYCLESGFDCDGIDLSFLNSNNKFLWSELREITDKGKVANAMAQVTPNGNTPTGTRVKKILNDHIDKLEAAKNTDAYGKIKPLDLIVITDGAPNDPPEFELTKMLVEAAARIKNNRYHPNSMGVQFVQIGNDPGAAQSLPKLLQADTGHMVDTVPYAGPGTISPDKLERILLGGLHPNIRAQNAP